MLSYTETLGSPFHHLDNDVMQRMLEAPNQCKVGHVKIGNILKSTLPADMASSPSCFHFD